MSKRKQPPTEGAHVAKRVCRSEPTSSLSQLRSVLAPIRRNGTSGQPRSQHTKPIKGTTRQKVAEVRPDEPPPILRKSVRLAAKKAIIIDRSDAVQQDEICNLRNCISVSIPQHSTTIPIQTLTDIPGEIMDIIVGYLPARATFWLAQCCRAMDEVVRAVHYVNGSLPVAVVVVEQSKRADDRNKYESFRFHVDADAIPRMKRYGTSHLWRSWVPFAYDRSFDLPVEAVRLRKDSLFHFSRSERHISSLAGRLVRLAACVEVPIFFSGYGPHAGFFTSDIWTLALHHAMLAVGRRDVLLISAELRIMPKLMQERSSAAMVEPMARALRPPFLTVLNPQYNGSKVPGVQRLEGCVDRSFYPGLSQWPDLRVALLWGSDEEPWDGETIEQTLFGATSLEFLRTPYISVKRIRDGLNTLTSLRVLDTVIEEEDELTVIAQFPLLRELRKILYHQDKFHAAVEGGSCDYRHIQSVHVLVHDTQDFLPQYLEVMWSDLICAFPDITDLDIYLSRGLGLRDGKILFMKSRRRIGELETKLVEESFRKMRRGRWCNLRRLTVSFTGQFACDVSTTWLKPPPVGGILRRGV
ncbi:hypothetical protein M427DRAFT_161316 [Gonapodya prolifera JEL478]|uniref:F-box domain-containing protein n=1 Tax=Gonapodya prolifera (strain JEL478) TaxID=1344416 RepID=A0A138ZWI9_GONPJ|nr:hypothetical protein M427DRAFT_161316 [Gonapodya prolifera JEL478]|eukprot:KXS08814.1 hypothetical protein M427DRAFT_161316 [Gonapodya prolifera JEL478]